MKKMIFAALLVAVWACNPGKNQEQSEQEIHDQNDETMAADHEGDHDAHDMGEVVNPHVEGKHAEEMVAELNVPSEFHKQLNGVFEASLPLKEAFVESDPEKVQETAQQVIDQLGKIDSKLLEPQAHEIWMQNLMSIAHLLDRIKNAGDIEEQRQTYAMYNRALYRSFKFLGHEGDPIYYQYCPMAFDNKGAYWLSESKEIRNPYFGDKMLTCGSTKEVLN